MQLHRVRTVALTALALAFGGGDAGAEEYFPPDGTGWWQLQSTDGTYTEVCAQGAGPCNPAPGTYTLIDFGTSPATRTRVTIEGEPTGGTLGVEIVYQQARISGLYVGSEIEGFSVPCPEGTVVIGGSCGLSAPYTVDGEPSPLEAEVGLSLTRNAATCSVLEDQGRDRYLASGTATAVCAVGTARTLPEIELEP